MSDADGPENIPPHTPIQGVGASEGIVIGKVAQLERRALPIERRDLGAGEVQAELTRFEAAVAASRGRLDRLRERFTAVGGDVTLPLLDAYLALLHDPALIDATATRVRAEQVNAEWALDRTLDAVRAAFAGIEERTIRERLQDVETVAERLLRHLLGIDPDDWAERSAGRVVVAHQLNPIDALHLIKRGVLGFVTETGSRSSHLAILARTHGVPCIVGAPAACARVREGALVVVDGVAGLVLIDPSPETLRQASERQRILYALHREFWARREAPVVTSDGFRVRVRGNCDLPDDADMIRAQGGEGVGLFRTEYVYLDREEFPSEEWQTEQYREVLRQFPQEGATIRTLDLGGDKFLSLRGAREHVPLAGLRAIRLCLARPDLFRTQLRALYRASVAGPLRILVPFVTSYEEVRQVLRLLAEVRQQLRDEGVPFRADVPVGLMVEIPSVAILAGLFARQVDFLSVGTNDLIQYTLAVERDNEQAAYLYQPLHPAVLKLLAGVAAAGRETGRPVAVCGEIASSPLFVPLLVGLGVDELSCSPRVIPVVKEVVRALSRRECQHLTARALALPCHDEVQAELEAFMAARFPRLQQILGPAARCLEGPVP